MIKLKKHLYIIPTLIICAILLIPDMLLTALAEESTAELLTMIRNRMLPS